MDTTLGALINQAGRLVQAEVYEEAVALCHAILRRYPRYARCYRILGEAYLGLGEYEGAADLLRRALGVDPEDPIAYAGMGVILEERNLLQEAIWQFERAFELAPAQDELRRELGRLYTRRGLPGRVQLTRAALARLYAWGGLWNKAVAELRELEAKEPYRLDLRATLARTLWYARRRQEAVETARSILDQAPNCLVARLIVGAYWRQQGRDNEGRALLQGARELDPENREATRLFASPSALPAPYLDAGENASFLLQEKAREKDGDRAEAKTSRRAPPAQAHAKRREAPAPQELEWPTLQERKTPPPSPKQQERVASEFFTGPRPETRPADSGPSRKAPRKEEAKPGGSKATPPAAAARPDPRVSASLAALRHRLELVPDDNQARLALARLLVESGELAEGLSIYDALATPSGLLSAVLADLEAFFRAGKRSRGLRQLLGDCYARAGRLQQAMEMYRQLVPEDRNDIAGGKS